MNTVVSVPKGFSADALSRQRFADRLAKVVTVLANAAVVPGGRVIGVDSPWGSGKTWIAERLPDHLSKNKEIGRCLYVNAFQFDFHSDPFSVLASAILKQCEDFTEATRDLRSAAGDVLKVTIPAVSKELIKAGAKTVGLDTDALADALADASGKLADRGIDRLLALFESTTASAAAFKDRLGKVAEASGGPLVIVIDELDRCRPDFALQLLERMKHLFDVKGVVFVLFLCAPALHAAIRHTYGDVDARGYLKKFVSIWAQVPNSDGPSSRATSRVEFLRRFISDQYPAPTTNAVHDFIGGVCMFGPHFNASFRDLQNAMLLGELAPQAVVDFADAAAYLLLLKLADQVNYERMMADEPAACELEVARLGSPGAGEDSQVGRFRDMFQYHANPPAYRLQLDAAAANRSGRCSEQDCKELMNRFRRTQSELKVEHLKL